MIAEAGADSTLARPRLKRRETPTPLAAVPGLTQHPLREAGAP
jgi:hypothetical protein